MSLNKESISILRQVKAAIIAEPEMYNQETSPYMEDCHTPCCIAGWAVWCAYKPTRKKYNEIVSRMNGCSLLESAAQLTYQQAQRLFYGAPLQFSDMWQKPRTKNAAIACGKRIDHFIATGGDE